MYTYIITIYLDNRHLLYTMNFVIPILLDITGN